MPDAALEVVDDVLAGPKLSPKPYPLAPSCRGAGNLFGLFLSVLGTPRTLWCAVLPSVPMGRMHRAQVSCCTSHRMIGCLGGILSFKNFSRAICMAQNCPFTRSIILSIAALVCGSYAVDRSVAAEGCPSFVSTIWTRSNSRALETTCTRASSLSLLGMTLG